MGFAANTYISDISDWLLGAKMSVLRNEPFATENIFRETCLFSVCLVAYDPY